MAHRPPLLRDTSTAARLRAEAEALLARGDRAAAAGALASVIRFDPCDDEAALLAAMLRHQDGEPREAAELAAFALRRRPFNPEALNLLGVACLDSGRAPIAAKLFAKAARMAACFSLAKLNLAQARRPAARARSRGTPSAGDAAFWSALWELARRAAPRLGATILVRPGEEDQLARSVEAVRPFCDDVVVIHAGRDDRGRAEAEAAGAFVERRDGVEDIAALRNEGIARLATDWILVLDASDRAEPGFFDAVGTAMDDENLLYVAAPLRRRDARPRPLSIRAFRNAPGIRFDGRVRDEVRWSLPPLQSAWGLGGAVLPCGLIVSTPPRAAEQAPAEREAERLELEGRIDDDAHSLGARVRLAQLDLDDGAVESAVASAASIREELAATSWGRNPVYLEIPAVLQAVGLARLGRRAELSKTLAAFHAHCPPTANTRLLEGLAAREAGDRQAALDRLREACSLQAEPAWAEPLPAVAGAGLSTTLGTALLDAGDASGARAAFAAALEIDADHLEAAIGMLGARLAGGDWEGLLQGLDELVERHGAHPRAWIAGGTLLGLVPELAEVKEIWMQEAARRHPGHVELDRLRTAVAS